jgi:DNA-binding NtrC family response regulator
MRDRIPIRMLSDRLLKFAKQTGRATRLFASGKKIVPPLKNAGPARLAGCRVLILEDEYFIAHDLEQGLKSLGAKIVGPIADLSEAQEQVGRDDFDVGVIDINLHDEMAYPIADELIQRRIPFVFVTGYGAEVIPERFRDVIRWEKPFEIPKLVAEIGRLCSGAPD